MTAPHVPLEITRATQLFSFLKEFAEQRLPKQKTIAQQLWSLALKELPDHPSIALSEVLPSDGGDDGSAAGGSGQPLLTVKRPKLTNAPRPPALIVPFVSAGWEQATGTINVLPAINRESRQGTVTERFEESTERVAALAEWKARWMEWSKAELPAVRAMAVYSRLYELRGKMALESEQVELLIGDGRLRWNRVDGQIDHPILLQRVELEFDTAKNEFRIVDADRPPELYTTVLDNEFITPGQHQALRVALEQGGFHPLAGELTSGFLRQVVGNLGPNGEFTDNRPLPAIGMEPLIGRDPYLILRTRPPGFASAFAKILDDLNRRTTLPVSLTRLTGVDDGAVSTESGSSTPPWGAPPDVLLSKPANDEQVKIARALEKNHAVLVQGPPGTGKSHTIANLIGHLVAQGKRVLVTSHSTKALKVLRDQVVEPLQPLCVSVLDTDSESRAQLESSIQGILSRLTGSSDDALGKEVADFAMRRLALNSDIATIVKDLETVRCAEYEPIVFGGESVAPDKAAVWVRDHREGNDWIPGPVVPGAPLPLGPAEITELYESTGTISVDEEAEITAGLPDIATLLAPAVFGEECAASGAREPANFAAFWGSQPSERDLPALDALNTAVRSTVAELERLAPWQRELVAVGHGGGTGPQLWEDLDRMIEEGRERWERSRPVLLEHSIDAVPAGTASELRKTAEELRTHLQGGGNLGFMALLFKGPWKAFVGATRVNGASPASAEAFNALAVHAALLEGRDRLATRWNRLALPAGLPSFAELSDTPEPRLVEYAAQFENLLTWWVSRWPKLERMAQDLGFRWNEYRAAAVAAEQPISPFERDATLLREGFQSVIGARAAAARAVVAERLLSETRTALESFQGAACRALDASAKERDPSTYATRFDAVQRLHAKAPLLERRRELLARLAASARAWAKAVHRRESPHAAAEVPGDPVAAWRWLQLRQEIVRRSELDETTLAARLNECQGHLRQATADLIDRKAWLGQMRRVKLPEQQALNGWAQLQRRIGRGTGRRAPRLQAEARTLLAKAQGAVPVWIMPLSRVAESVDPVNGRFDVVIIDEASQCDITGLLAWYLADQIIVVGDDKQVSPMAVGQLADAAQSMINRHLGGFPNSQLYDGQASLYDLAQQSFGGTIRLREHFRCMPDIIEFSNQLSYDFEIQPLRDPTAAPAPHVVEHVVSGGSRDGKTNLLEAQTVAATIASMMERGEYAGKSIGAISLLGDEQAHLIWTLTGQIVEAKDLEDRRFLAGNSAQFQGDERHIIFLSMVDVPKGGPLTMRQEPYLRQRYNVAASRAKDQLWVMHSLDPIRDLQPKDLRRELIEYVRAPGARGAAAERAKARAESPFEVEVIQRLSAKGYAVESQVKVGSYRIDMVVRGSGGQVALECDGARYHPLDKIPDDLARQAILERCGWRFVRIRSTAYFADRDAAMERVFAQLSDLGVEPDAFSGTADTGESDPHIEAIRRRAWEIMRERKWVEVADPTEGDGDQDSLFGGGVS